MGMIFDVLSESPSIVNGSRLYLIKNEKFIKYAPVGKCQRVKQEDGGILNGGRNADK
jgi:hypothetical protein